MLKIFSSRMSRVKVLFHELRKSFFQFFFALERTVDLTRGTFNFINKRTMCFFVIFSIYQKSLFQTSCFQVFQSDFERLISSTLPFGPSHSLSLGCCATQSKSIHVSNGYQPFKRRKGGEENGRKKLPGEIKGNTLKLVIEANNLVEE